MTDVQIATQLLNDAYRDVYDRAILVSADGDLVPPIRTILAEFPLKRVEAFFPPKRSSRDLRTYASAAKRIWNRAFERSQLPDRVTKADGHVLVRPSRWT
jgi:uncharacterized LabA/DUF88 family protein